MAIELPSRSADGTKNNMRGIEIDGFNPAIDEILIQANAREGVETLRALAMAATRWAWAGSRA